VRNAARHLADGFQPLRLSQQGFDFSLFRHVGQHRANGQPIPPLNCERPALEIDDRTVRSLAFEGIEARHVAAFEALLVVGHNPRQFAFGEKRLAVRHILDFVLISVAENPRHLAVGHDWFEVSMDQDADIRLFDQGLKSLADLLDLCFGQFRLGDVDMGNDSAAPLEPAQRGRDQAKPSLLLRRMAGIFDRKFGRLAGEDPAHAGGDRARFIGPAGHGVVAYLQIIAADSEIPTLQSIGRRKPSPRIVDLQNDTVGIEQCDVIRQCAQDAGLDKRHPLAFRYLLLQGAIRGFELDGLFLQFPHQRCAVLLDDVLIAGVWRVRGFGAGVGSIGMHLTNKRHELVGLHRLDHEGVRAEIDRQPLILGRRICRRVDGERNILELFVQLPVPQQGVTITGINRSAMTRHGGE
jgi:hypothetical protein